MFIQYNESFFTIVRISPFYQSVKSSCKNKIRANLCNLIGFACNIYRIPIFRVFLGKNWKTHRKILTSAFHFGMLQDFVNVFYKQTENLISKLNEHGSMEINIIPLIAEFSLMCIAGITLFLQG